MYRRQYKIGFLHWAVEIELEEFLSQYVGQSIHVSINSNSRRGIPRALDSDLCGCRYKKLA